jgi:hypothetical protein
MAFPFLRPIRAASSHNKRRREGEKEEKGGGEQGRFVGRVISNVMAVLSCSCC